MRFKADIGESNIAAYSRKYDQRRGTATEASRSRYRCLLGALPVARLLPRGSPRIRRRPALRVGVDVDVGRQLPVLGPALVGGLWLMWWLGFNLSVAVAVTTPWPEEARDDATDNDPCPDRDVPTVPDVAD